MPAQAWGSSRWVRVRQSFDSVRRRVGRFPYLWCMRNTRHESLLILPSVSTQGVKQDRLLEWQCPECRGLSRRRAAFYFRRRIRKQRLGLRPVLRREFEDQGTSRKRRSAYLVNSCSRIHNALRPRDSRNSMAVAKQTAPATLGLPASTQARLIGGRVG